METKNGKAQFQRMTEDLLQDLDCGSLFVDDIVVSGGTPKMTDDELIHAGFVDLCNVLDVLRKHQLTYNGAKAVLFATEVDFAGQVVGHGNLRPVPGKLVPLAH